MVVQPISYSGNERGNSRCAQWDKRLHILMAKPFDLVCSAMAYAVCGKYHGICFGDGAGQFINGAFNTAIMVKKPAILIFNQGPQAMNRMLVAAYI